MSGNVPGGPGAARRSRAARRRAAGASTTIGGLLVGFDEQVWRRQPPAQERVAQVDRANVVPAPGGLMIALPDAEP